MRGVVAWAGARRRAMRLGALTAAALLLVLGTARAQLVSDVVPVDRVVSAKQTLDADLANSTYHLGPIRLLPGFDLSNAGYNSNVFGHPQNPEGDWTATLNVGTKLILPFGGKFYFIGDFFPGYTWYAKFSDLSSFSGTASGAFAAYFNRLSIDAGIRGTEHIVILSEVPQPTLSKTVNVYADFDLKLTGTLSFFTEGDGLKVRDTQPGVPLEDKSLVQRYNRTDKAIEGGLRYSFAPGWTITPEVQYTTSDFEFTPEERNNTSLGYLLGLHYNGDRFYVNLIGGYREGDEWNSTFPHYATPVGSYFVSYFIRPWLEVRSDGQRRVAYSVDIHNPYYYNMLVAGVLNIQVHPRILLKGFGGVGQNKYPIPQPAAGVIGAPEVQRLDKLSNYGGGASVILSRRLTLTVLATQKKDVSNLPANSYSILQYSTFLTFAGEFMR
jgi:hypothetical protein